MDDRSGYEREIEVRSLMGDSVRVSIEPSNTIQDLKLRLRQCFSPAASAPDFHLFLKGVKLDLLSEISNYSIGVTEFLVAVPFIKKDRQHRQRVEASETVAKDSNSNDRLPNDSAESVWSDLMQDLSCFQDLPNHENLAEAKVKSRNSENENASEMRTSLTMKRREKVFNKGKEKPSCDALLNILPTSGDGMLDEQSLKKFLQFLDSSSCLSDPGSGSCVMREADAVVGCKLDSCKSSSCLCPLWLKDMIKTFILVNVYSAYLQLLQKQITVAAVMEPLEQLHKFGYHPCIMDLDLLSQLCPQLILIVEKEEETTNIRDALVIYKFSSGKSYQLDCQLGVEAGKRLSKSKVVSSMKKRETSFRAILTESAKLLMMKSGIETAESFSLEDLKVFLKEKNFEAAESEVKRERRRSATSTSCSYQVNCHETNSLQPEEMVGHLKSNLGSRGQVVHIEKLSGRSAKYAEIPSQLSENMKFALERVGITRLYSHQAKSIQASLAGKNVIVATMTSSGKSLCYNIPVLEMLSHNPLACALYLFPTKALAQDQMRALLSISKGLDDSLNIGIYDGDTSMEDRLWLRDNARLLITNPDMLHVSILPFHGQFRRILSNLRFIVIDEAHSYKGAFGSHAALIFRRLRRICSHVYSSDPSFIFSTATSANPQEHAMELANLSTVEVIADDGSPSALKLFMLWNPPLCLKTVWKRTKASLGAKKSVNKVVVAGRSSPILEVSQLFAEMVQHGLRCIAFCKTRKLCELVLCYTREILHDSAPHLANKVYSYRGGYVAEDRRRIESDFFNGNICGVAATSALELGIDVGEIDVTLHLGFPGSIASMWQQAGRSGRRGKPSLSIYVAFEGPLDQYFMKFPNKLFRGSIECCHVDPNNDQVLQQHLSCAALEHPLSFLYDVDYFGPGLENAVMKLKSNGYLNTDMSRDYAARMWTYIGQERSPSSAVSIRAIETVRYKVIDKINDEVLEEIEESKAFFQVYEGAVYMNQGKTYLVKQLDLSSKIAWCQRADVKYYTKTRDYTDIHVIGSDIAYPARIANGQFAETTAQAHICKVTTTWFGFRRIWRRSNQVIDTVELSLPDYTYESQAVWIRVPQSVKAAVEASHYSFDGGLHAAGHALLNVVPLFVICNQSDIASECANPHDNRYVPERILLYDPHPGGTGISRKVQPVFVDMLTAALELLSSCQCSGDGGCPNCVQNLGCTEYNEVLHKDAAIMIIKGVVDAEQSNLHKNNHSPTS
ncbi:uncharacterized protein LOC131020283 isoform X2 [Salvia miltiorrhiza]|uniref:uncharacterized protein LOC131020283 isoform X2 n=1 Tax=Salvia miltiorrhiza TaxID=226208 RepID=UPI0025AD6860|nr:uncharacterized protein LOC131020283 isoform X2 [Salvia miltiorrhiza]